MNRKEKIIDGFLLIIVIACVFGLIIQLRERQIIRPWSLSQAEINHINAVLNSKNAPDCILEPTFYGWKCVGKDKKIYRIARR